MCAAVSAAAEETHLYIKNNLCSEFDSQGYLLLSYLKQAGPGWILLEATVLCKACS